MSLTRMAGEGSQHLRLAGNPTRSGLFCALVPGPCGEGSWRGCMNGPQSGRKLDFPSLPVPLGGCDGACAPRTKPSVCWRRVPEQALEGQSQVRPAARWARGSRRPASHLPGSAGPFWGAAAAAASGGQDSPGESPARGPSSVSVWGTFLPSSVPSALGGLLLGLFRAPAQTVHALSPISSRRSPGGSHHRLCHCLSLFPLSHLACRRGLRTWPTGNFTKRTLRRRRLTLLPCLDTGIFRR